MYIRQTKTRSSTTGESYSTFRLVVSERIGQKVRQKTLLNLGRHFGVPAPDWPLLCICIEQLLTGQTGLLDVPESLAKEAQHCAARLLAAAPVAEAAPEADYAEVDIHSLQLTQPRTVGIEQAALAALDRLGLSSILAERGFRDGQIAIALALVVARMAAPASELATWRWLQERSAMGELLNVDFARVGLHRLYRISDLLTHHREAIEQALFARIDDLFHRAETVTLYDLTNTYFEGTAAGNDKAARGHSKEKRTDCPLVTLGLVLDGSGFVRRSRMFAGNVAEGGTLK
ncbi:hypothetical protein JKG47_22030, partial [Acidithiobacillus sp. MC6.1]|nr:hypothetical protein [Acidithiobacillus sp. MC6.1]